METKELKLWRIKSLGLKIIPQLSYKYSKYFEFSEMDKNVFGEMSQKFRALCSILYQASEWPSARVVKARWLAFAPFCTGCPSVLIDSNDQETSRSFTDWRISQFWECHVLSSIPSNNRLSLGKNNNTVSIRSALLTGEI